MKPLTEYPTPETEASLTGGEMYSDALFDVSRSLEKRLAACRDTLQKVTDECLWRSDSEFPLSPEKSQELYDLAIETLTLTAPKP